MAPNITTFKWNTANFAWDDNPYTWDDVQLIQEVADQLDGGGSVSKVVDKLPEKKKKKLNELNFSEVKKIRSDLNENVMKVFNVINSVNLKTSYGGTSTKNIKMMISKIKKELK